MNHRHFETFRPVCPVCRTADSSSEVKVTRAEREGDGRIYEGMLGCPNDACQHEYPIIDGVPLLLPNLREYVSTNVLALLARDDLGADTESLIGDCCGPGSAFEHLRLHLSSYAWSHYAEWDPEEGRNADETQRDVRGVAAVLESSLKQAGAVAGPFLDAGCAVGGTTFALAEKTDELVLGVDVNFSMLRVAQRVLRDGVVEYPRRRSGVVYDRRRFEVPLRRRDNVDFWACDAAALPLAPPSFATVIGLHTLDSVASPLALLTSLADALAVGGKLILACPYDWTAAVTPMEHWLGGHSQRGRYHGASDKIVADLLTPGAHPASIEGLQLIHQSDDIMWHVRWHDRGMIQYRVHLVVAERR